MKSFLLLSNYQIRKNYFMTWGIYAEESRKEILGEKNAES